MLYNGLKNRNGIRIQAFIYLSLQYKSRQKMKNESKQTKGILALKEEYEKRLATTKQLAIETGDEDNAEYWEGQTELLEIMVKDLEELLK
jgi:hypothetical protein